MRRLFASLALVVFSAAAASAQQINIRGEILAVEGERLSVKTREGETLSLDVPVSARISTTLPFALSDIKPGMTLGVTTIRRADGAVVAIDVRPIPATASLGLSPFDLQPESTMTNAVSEGAVVSADGQTLTLNYKSGSVTVLVPPGTPMSQAAPGDAADMKPRETIFAVARPGEGGRLTAVRVQVSKNGVKPTQ